VNVARDIERVIRDALAQNGNLPKGVRVIAWQTPDETAGWDHPDSPAWSGEDDRRFPLIEVSCTPPASDEKDETALTCEVSILCATKAGDDRDRKILRAMYEVAQDYADGIAAAWYEERPEAFDAFAEALERLEPRVRVGGATAGTPAPPAEGGGLYMLGAAVQIHFCITPKPPEQRI